MLLLLLLRLDVDGKSVLLVGEEDIVLGGGWQLL